MNCNAVLWIVMQCYELQCSVMNCNAVLWIAMQCNALTTSCAEVHSKAEKACHIEGRIFLSPPPLKSTACDFLEYSRRKRRRFKDLFHFLMGVDSRWCLTNFHYVLQTKVDFPWKETTNGKYVQSIASKNWLQKNVFFTFSVFIYFLFCLFLLLALKTKVAIVVVEILQTKIVKYLMFIYDCTNFLSTFVIAWSWVQV